MKQRKIKQLVFVLSISALTLNSCTDKDVYQGEHKNEPLKPTEVFDFNLTKDVEMSVDYGFTNDYYIIFELYDQNPMKEVDGSWIKDEELDPIFAAATDKQGKYADTATLSAALTEVWLYSDYMGAVSPVKLTVSDSGIDFNQAKYIAALQTKTRGVTSNGHNYVDDWTILPGVDWDQYGYPSNIETELSLPSAEVLYSIRGTYTKNGNYSITTAYPDWFNNNATSEIKITKATELSLVFVNSSAGWNNTVGYFTYPTGTIPTADKVKRIVAFPNASPISKVSNGQRVGSLLCGHAVKLKYWNEETQQYEDKFPAGVTVGWCLEGQGFYEGDLVKRYTTRYSYSSMNSDNKQRVVALRHGSANQIVAIGFEDNVDYDYCDATFYLKIAESDAIDTESPELPPVEPPTNVTTTTKGTLAYEDQWPSEGDYDMNDVMMTYKSTVYKKTQTNKIYKIVDEFTPIHNGGTDTCGFGYQLHTLTPGQMTSIKVTGPEGWKVETEQSHPTIILFDNIKNVLNKKYTVTIELDDVENVTPPYNPFIFVNSRNHEVHLVNYPPTDEADMGLFNTQDDVSNVGGGVYYIARYNGEVELMPYGINLPTLEFEVPAENVKIYDTYPGFIDWVKSKGDSNQNWYVKKNN